jgi:hypothetical protein
VGEERCIQDFGGETRGKHHLKDPGIDGRTIIKLFFERYGGMDWLELGQVRDRWWAVVNAVMNFRVPIKCGEFFE